MAALAPTFISVWARSVRRSVILLSTGGRTKVDHRRRTLSRLGMTPRMRLNPNSSFRTKSRGGQQFHSQRPNFSVTPSRSRRHTSNSVGHARTGGPIAMRRVSYLSAVATACWLIASAAAAQDVGRDEAVDSEYGKVFEKYEKYWEELPKKEADNCRTGRTQSPITLKGWTAGTRTISFTDQGRWLAVRGSSPHTVKIDFPRRDDVPTRKIKVDDKEYTLAQLHFHLPSEHVLGREDSRYDERAPMEMHIVFTKPDQSVGAVVGVFLAVDNGIINFATGNPRAGRVGQLEAFLELFPPPTRRAKADIGIDGKLMDTLLPPAGKRGYITYSGSLTTPGCDPGVTWIVMTTPLVVSPEFYNEFARRFPMNARWPQRVNGRKLESGTIN